MRMVRQRVLPLPAPALTSSGEPGAASTASRCAASSASSAAASAMSTAPAPLLENTADSSRRARKRESQRKKTKTTRHSSISRGACRHFCYGVVK